MADAQGFVSVASTASDVPSTTPLTAGLGSSGSAAPDTEGGNGVRGQISELFRRSSHPTAALFHVLFKTAALIFYITSGLLGSSFVMTFVITVILMAFDFWTVKNITGRLMVGLRWWNDVADDGTATWRYESIDDPNQVSRADYTIFWYSMYIAAFLWGLFSVYGIITISIERLLISGVAFTLVWSNIYGFWNCSSERARVEQSVQNVIASGTMAALTGKLGFGGLTGASSASATSVPKGGDAV